MANDEPGWTGWEGDPVDVPRRKPARKVTDFLGEHYTVDWPANLKALTYEDLLRINGWIPRDDAYAQEAAESRARISQIDVQDLMNRLATAIQAKTSWMYVKDEPPACCCCWPGWPR